MKTNDKKDTALFSIDGKKRGSVIYSTDRKNEGNEDVYLMASASLGDWKRVQDARFDNHLTGVKKESFHWLTKTIAHNKGCPRK